MWRGGFTRFVPRGHEPDRLPVEGLTPREEQVARMVARGLSNAEIAQELAISPGTVKIHVGRLYRKAGVANRHQLLSLFIEDMFDPDLMPTAVSAPDRAAITAAAPEHS